MIFEMPMCVPQEKEPDSAPPPGCVGSPAHSAARGCASAPTRGHGGDSLRFNPKEPANEPDPRR
jgi:hypothetical protein